MRRAASGGMRPSAACALGERRFEGEHRREIGLEGKAFRGFRVAESALRIG